VNSGFWHGFSSFPTNMKALRILVTAFLTTGIGCVAHAQLFTYNFADVVAGNSSTSGGGTSSNLTFSSVTANGVSATSNAGGVFSFTSWSTGATTSTDTFSGALDASDYYQFTVTPDSSYQYTLTSITFDAGRSSTGARQFEVRSCIDSFTTELTSSASNPAVSIVSSNVFQFTDNTSTATYSGNSITLSGLNFTGISSSITFRIYAYNAEGTSGTFRLDNLAINGSSELAAVPEPSTYAAILGGVALIGVIAIRRRKKFSAA